MSETPPPLVPEHPPLLEQLATFWRENAALRVENAALHDRIRELEARLRQSSANSSRPPSSDPPQVLTRPKAPPSGRKRGGQRGHRETYRAGPLPQREARGFLVPDGCHCVRVG